MELTSNSNFSFERTLSEQFEYQASICPGKTAIVCNGDKLTYAQLNEQSNQLARYLKSRYYEQTGDDLQAGTLILLCLDRSIEMIIAILAVLKSGAVYVPIDPSLPEDRIKFIFQDTSSRLLITDNDIIGGINSNLITVRLKDTSQTEWKKLSNTNLPVNNTIDDLAYIIYTSGTTGQPKGVMVAHGSVMNTLSALNSVYAGVPIKKSTAFTSYVFDVSVSEIFNSLFCGLELHLLTGELRTDTVKLAKYLVEQKINLTYLPPIVLAQLPDLNSEHLHTIIYAGEPCDKKTAERWSQRVELYNYYGPTEASIYVTGKRIVSSEVEQIGVPICNMYAFVLDEELQEVRPGEIGELCVGGPGLARGYWNRPDLTSRSFIENPLKNKRITSSKTNTLYRTGDLVRWEGDNLVFLGRKDDQVKIRGYRIELGEVTNALSQIEGISSCCVVLYEKQMQGLSNRYLTGYFVLEESLERKILEDDIHRELEKLLPAYMVPSFLVQMNEIPMTVNGKLDKESLPEPTFSSDKYHPPSTNLEKASCELWQGLLGVEKIGVSDNFFKLGGTSILAIQLANRMRENLHVEVSVGDFFVYKNIRSILHHCTDPNTNIIESVKETESVLSFAQQRLWFISQYEQNSNAYHIPVIYKLVEGTNFLGVKYALEQIVRRHEILRTTIDHYEGQGRQCVHQDAIDLEVCEISSGELDQLLKDAINRPFQLAEDYPIRIQFYRVDGDIIHLLINIHHIASDGWSMSLLVHELDYFYKKYIGQEDHDAPLPELTIQYKDFATWQREYLSEERLEKQIAFWKQKLSNHQRLTFPTDRRRGKKVSTNGSSLAFKVDPVTSDGLKALAASNGTSLYSVMLSGVYILLGRYSNQRDIIIGSPIANRQHPQTSSLIGFFVNMVVNRGHLEKDETFAQLISKVQSEQADMHYHQDVPFEKLLEGLNIERQEGLHPVFQISFAMEQYQETPEFLRPVDHNPYYPVEPFDLSITIDGNLESMVGRVSYSTELFDADTIARLVNNYLVLLSNLTKTPDLPYDQVNILNEHDKHLVLNEWNNTIESFESNKTVHQLFIEQAKKTPNHVAVVGQDGHLTYQELDEKSNQLARYIDRIYKQKFNQHIEKDTLILLCVHRNVEMIVGMLAILKLGAAYVPIDPDNPQDRIDFVIEDTKSNLVLTERDLENCKSIDLRKTRLYIGLQESFYQEEDFAEVSEGDSSNLAYIIYTSGTTGLPKGVMLEHRNLSNLLYGQQVFLGINSNWRVLQYASTVFDASVWEIFNALINGAQLHVVPVNVRRDAKLLHAYMEENKINLALLPPGLLQVMPDKPLPELHTLVVGGEVCPTDVMDKWSINRRLINAYGPTESTVCATMNHYHNGDANTNIGYPLMNQSVYVLNDSFQPVPIGAVGELYIAGNGLARGYLNQKDLTNKKFITLTLSSGGENIRLYKSGDLVKWLPGGCLEYVGRNDHQVKLRGYRIELGEIEEAIKLIPEVTQVAVIATTNKDQNSAHLIAYYVTDSQNQITSAELRNELAQKLPEYMIPSAFMPLEEFPMTINGKLDKKALPEPVFTSMETYVAPETEMEMEATQIWMDLLGQEKVGVNDDFFRLGGTSILAVQVSHLMTKALKREVSVGDIFKYRNIKTICDHLEIKKQSIDHVEWSI